MFSSFFKKRSTPSPRRTFRLDAVLAMEDRIVPASPVAMNDAGFATSEDAILTVVPSSPGPVSNAGADMLANERPDNANETQNPNFTAPVWSYGQRATTLGPALTLYTAAAHENGANGGVWDGFSDLNQQCCGRLPHLYVNAGPAAAFPDGIANTGDILMHPDGSSGGGFVNEEKPVVRYTAALAGNYSVSALWEDLNGCCTQNGGAGVDVHVVRNRAGVSTLVFETSISREADALPTGATYSGTIGLGVGDSIDFVVGTNSQLFGDETRFNATVQYQGGSVLFDNGNGPDTDADGDPLTVTSFSAASANGATVSVAANGGFTFNPATSAAAQALAPGGTLVDTFTYTISDGNGGTSSATVSVLVTGVNDAPVLATPAPITFNDTPANDVFTFISGTLSANDVDGPGLTYGLTGSVADGSVAGFDRSRTTAFGTLFLNTASGATRYVPNSAAINALSAATTDLFTVTVGDGSLSDSKTFTVNLAGVNDTPVAQNDAGFSTTEDAVLSIPAVAPVVVSNAGADMLANEKPDNANEAQNPNFTAPVWSYGQRGTTLGPGLTLFTAANHENGAVGGVMDGFSDLNVQCCGRLPQMYVNTGPAAGFPNGTLATGEMLIHPDGDAGGSFVGEEKGVVRYTAQSPGNYSVSALWEDLNNCCTQNGGAGVDVHVVRNRGGVSTALFNEAISRETGDALPDSTTYSGVIALGVGDSIDFVVGTNSQLFGDATRFNATVQYLGGGVLVDNGNGADSDRDNDSLAVTSFSATSAQGATVSVAPDGGFTYNPQTSLAAQQLQVGGTLIDTFTYVVSDGHGGTASATASVLVTGVNDAPVLTPVAFTINDTAANDSFSAVNGTLSASDVDSSSFTYALTGSIADGSVAGFDRSRTSSFGTLYLNTTTGAYRYVPNSAAVNALSASTPDTFTVSVSDGAASDSRSFTVTLAGVNDTPVAVNDGGFSTSENATLTIVTTPRPVSNAGADMLANEKPDNPNESQNPNFFAPVWSYGQRGATLGPALTLFTPANHENGISGVLDGFSDLNSQCCGRLPMMYVNTGPTAGFPEGSVATGEMILHPDGNPGGGFVGEEKAVVRYTAASSGEYSVSALWEDINSCCTQNGGAGVDVHVVHNRGGVSTQLFGDAISREADALPTGTTYSGTITLFAGDSIDFVVGTNSQLFGDATRFNALVQFLRSGVLVDNGGGPDSDRDGDTLTVSAFDAVSASGATVSVAPGGGFTYDPSTSLAAQSLASGETLTDTFTYTISDGHGDTSTATVSVLVTGVSDAVNDAYNLFANELLVANDAPGTTPDTTPSSGTFNGVLANDDPYGPIEVRTVQSAQSGGVQTLSGPVGVPGGQATFLTDQGCLVTIHDDGTFTYNQQGVFSSLLAGQTATDSFTYTYAGRTYNAGADMVANETPNGTEANPNPVAGGVWSYGKRPSAGGASFTPLAIHADNFAGNGGLQGWQGGESVGGGASMPAIVANVTGAPITDAAVWGAPGGPMPAGGLSLHPATGSDPNPFNIVRWTAPATGVYRLVPSWADISNGGVGGSRGVDVHIVINGVSIYDALVSLETGPASVSTNQVVTLSAGTTVDFVVGPNGTGSDAYYNDGTVFNADISLVSASATVTFNVTGNPIPAHTYADDDWIGFANGTLIPDADPVAPGGQPAIFGTSAFSSVSAAVAAVELGGPVTVNGGTYAETVVINRNVALNLQPGTAGVTTVSFQSVDDTLGAATIALSGITFTVGAGTLASPISGGGSLVKTGTGTLTFTGTAANTFAGGTTVQGGTLALAKTGAESLPGPIVIGDNIDGGVVKTAILRVDTSNQIADSAVISFSGNDGRLFIASGSETIANPTALAMGDIKVAGNLTLTSAFTQTAGSSVTMAGGTLRIGTAGTFGGTDDYALAGILQGSGTIYTKILTSTGTIDPSSGASEASLGNATPGILTIRGNLQMTASSVTNLDVGATASDRLNVGINIGLALPAGSYQVLSNYDIDPFLRGDAPGILGGATELARRGVNDLYNVNGTVRFHGTLNTRPIQGNTLTNNVTYGNSMNFVWRALNLPTGGFWGDLNPKGANLSSVPSDFTSRNSLDVNGAPATAVRFDPRYMGSAGQFNAVGQAVNFVTKVNGNDQAALSAPASSVGQAKALTLTSLTSSATVDTTVVKVTKQLWNAMKDSHTRVTLTIANTSAAAVTGPIYLELTGIPAGATLFNGAGKRPSTGKPYLVVPAASLAAGASVTMEVDLLTPITLGKYPTLTTQVLRGGMP